MRNWRTSKIALISLFSVVLAGVAVAPEFTYVPPQQVVYWTPPAGFGAVAPWEPPTEFSAPPESWQPPTGYEKTSQPWSPPKGWESPTKQWEPIKEWR
jgi:hypothetical protein